MPLSSKTHSLHNPTLSLLVSSPLTARLSCRPLRLSCNWTMEDFDSLRPRYAPRPPPSRSPFDTFLGEGDSLEDAPSDDDRCPSPLSAPHDPHPSFLSQLKNLGPKLLPFLKTLALYFVVFVPADKPSWVAVLLKTLPTASLALFVVLHGVRLQEEHAFARRILAGLVLSAVGDALLVWPSCFLQGMTAFCLAQVAYISAFGLSPLSGTLGVVIYAFTSIGLGLVVPGLMLSADVGLLMGVPLYFTLLTTMLWRAWARVEQFEDLWTWSKVSASLGAMAFVISDALLGMDKFFLEVPNSQVFIMATYYAAQLGMALSVVDAHTAHLPQQSDSRVIDMGSQDCVFGRRGSSGTLDSEEEDLLHVGRH